MSPLLFFTGIPLKATIEFAIRKRLPLTNFQGIFIGQIRPEPFFLTAPSSNYSVVLMSDLKAKFKEHQKSLNQEKILEGRFCSRPFRLLEIHRDFHAFPCCPSWLPVIVGNCERSSIMDVWNSPQMQEIRRSIHNGSFHFCDHLECPEIQANRLPQKKSQTHFNEVIQQKLTYLEGPPEEIALCYDETCNLACPSCRNQKIAVTKGREFERRLHFTDQVISLIEKYCDQYPIVLRVTGSGDPFASPVFYKLLKSLDAEKHPKLSISLQTNGVMLTEKIWQSLHRLHRAIIAIGISIDASTPETYSRVRKFGSWDQLQKNLVFLAHLRGQNTIKSLNLNFVVQKENFREMPAFVQMAKNLAHIDQVFFSFVNDWNTWSKSDYIKQCIWKKDHPEFSDFLTVLKHPLLSDSCVHLGNITEYRVQALTEEFRTVRQRG